MKQITEIIDSGQTDAAHEALDQLLALGPNNTEALKLRASLFEREGRFRDEAKIWDKIATIDREDEDAVSYLLRRQLEDRENYYFTDDVSGGGRRFMAYPRALINNSALGLAGCIAFLLTTRLSAQFPALGEATTMLSLFSLLVLAPWFSILVVYVRCIRFVTVTSSGITVSTRLRSHAFAWAELERVCLARSSQRRGPFLSLVLIPKDQTRRPVEIDLNQGTTAIRARSYLVQEISRYHQEPQCVGRETLDLARRKPATY